MQKTKQYFFLFAIFILVSKGFAGGVKPSESQSTIKFTENKNQWDKRVLYRAQLDGGVLFLEKNCFTYNFYDKETLRENHIRKQKANSPASSDQLKTQNSKLRTPNIRSHAFRMTFVGASKAVEVSEKQATPDYCNFFIGNDKSKWVGNAKNYKEVNYQSIYNGIDLQVLGLQNSLKYNFIAAPQANTDDIQLYYDGIEKIELQRGALLLKTSINEFTEQKPYAYQLIDGIKKEVPCEFVLTGTTVSFRFPKGYDKSNELIIDPVLVFACSSGSSADNFGMTATYDAQGCLYAGGTCFDQGYPVTVGAYDGTYNGVVLGGRTDVIISKYDASGTFMQYSTYFGGATSTEVVSSLIVNAQNELMLFGATGSSDFPVTTGAFDVTFNGGTALSFPFNGTEYDNGTDLYVSKFNSTGTSLLASTYVGGSQNDGVNNSNTLVYNYGDYYRGEIQVDPAGNCYIASCTYSSNFPTAVGPQLIAGGGMDGVVFKMPPNLSSLTWSTYIGGNADDGCYALNIDSLSNVYTTGGTSSTNFYTTAGSISTTYNGGITDGFVTKIKNDGSSILKSTFIGTSAYDQSFLIQFDNNYNVYIVGQSEGAMPVSAGVYSNSNSKQFIWKIKNDLSAKMFSTIFGSGSGQVDISPSAFLVDACGNIFACGWGGNVITGVPTNNMPVTSNAYQSSTDGFNFYLFVLAPNAASLLYGTYFGGPLSREHVDGGTSRFDKKGIVYQAVCAGCGGNDDFPVTAGSWPHTGSNVNHAFNCNEGVFKFDFQATGVSSGFGVAPNDTVCLGSPVSFNNTSINAHNYLWTFGDGSAPNTQVSPSHTFLAAGTYTVRLIAIDSSGCIFSDTTTSMITVVPPPSVNLGNDTVLCQTPSITLNAGTSGFIYQWSTGATSQTIVASSFGAFWAKVSNLFCSDSDTITINQVAKPNIGNDTTLCTGQTLLLSAPAAAVSYHWSTGAVSKTITVSAAGQYWVSVDFGICQKSDTIIIAYTSYPVVNLPPAVQICHGDSIQLNPGTNQDASYLWSNGNVTQTSTVFSGGTYTVKVSRQQCSVSDTTVVSEVAPLLWKNNISLCNVEKYTLDAGVAGGGTYLWSTGDTTQKINVTLADTYWVQITTSLCKFTDTVNVHGDFGAGVLWVPNSFTPNGDLLNDYFMPKGDDITDYQMMIFNRWGELIFQTDKMEVGWNGTFKGVAAEQDVYVWKVKYKTICSENDVITAIGNVTVIR
jgi:gliding motility-associated-like protein